MYPSSQLGCLLVWLNTRYAHVNTTTGIISILQGKFGLTFWTYTLYEESHMQLNPLCSDVKDLRLQSASLSLAVVFLWQQPALTPWDLYLFQLGHQCHFNASWYFCTQIYMYIFELVSFWGPPLVESPLVVPLASTCSRLVILWIFISSKIILQIPRLLVLGLKVMETT